MASQIQNGDFLWNGYNDFCYISVNCGDHIPKEYSIFFIFRHITVRAVGAPTRYADFVEACFTGLTDFIVHRRSVITNGVPSISRFHFQGNSASVSRMWGTLYTSFALTLLLCQ
jgi:hypothetical protein